MWMTISCSGYTILHTEVAPGFRKEPTNDFHRALYHMYNNVSATGMGHWTMYIYIVTCKCILNDSNKGQAWLLGAPLRTTIDTGRSRVAGGGTHYFYIRALKYVGLSDLLWTNT